MIRGVIVSSIVAFMMISKCSGALADANGLIQTGGHYPTSIGIKYVWAMNDGNVPVTISFVGPWDLTKGPKDKTFVTEIISKATAYKYAQYPLATFAFRLSGAGTFNHFDFYRKASNGIFWYGQSSVTGGDADFLFTKAIRRIFFPAKQGIAVAQQTSIKYSDRTVPATYVLRYVGQGTATVGAGVFNDAVMLQTKVTIKDTVPVSYIQYDWIAPYLGHIALIKSLDGETNEHFTTASQYFWIRTATVP